MSSDEMISRVARASDALTKAFYIAKKDAKAYYFKAPNFTYGLLMPVSLFLAFSLTGRIELPLILVGLPALAIMFGTMSIEAVAIVLEKQTGTFQRLLAAPVSFLTLLCGKALSGCVFGLVLGVLVYLPLVFLSGVVEANGFFVVMAMILIAFMFSSLGVLISAYATWVPEAQMLSNLLRFPMTFLSSTFLSFSTMPVELQFIARWLPLTYALDALRLATYEATNVWLFLGNIAVLSLYAFVFLIVASKVLQRKLE
jgi:ABC-2 type transport system permease protein